MTFSTLTPVWFAGSNARRNCYLVGRQPTVVQVEVAIIGFWAPVPAQATVVIAVMIATAPNLNSYARCPRSVCNSRYRSSLGWTENTQ